MANNLLILERSTTELEFKQDGGVYILEGIFGEIDKKNKNNRIYTESEYLPQIEALQAKIKASKLLGELDHPANFDVSLKNVSHVIEELTYDKETKQVKGRIKLLDTDAGRQAKALVDAGVPLQISSRAAGAVESNGQVKIKQLFTYDLVADPGFENAELTRMNESFGLDNDGILIYEINTTEQKTTENKNENKMAESKFISTEDFNKYSQYLSEEIKSIKETMTSLTEGDNGKSEVESLKEYTDYLAKKLDESIAYSNYLAEKTDQSISYSEKLAETVDNGIAYSEHIAEGVDAIKNYTNYLAESYNEGATSHQNVMEYIEYLRENLEKVTEYAEYVAETVNNNLLVEDEAGLPAEEIKADLEDVTVDVVDGDDNVIDSEPKNVEADLELEGEGDAEGKEITEEAEVEVEVEISDEESKEDETEEDETEVEESEEDAEEVSEWAVRGMDANFDNPEDEKFVRDMAKKLGVRMTFDPEGNAPYAGALSFSSKNKAAVLKMAAQTGHLNDIKDGLYDLVEAAQVVEDRASEIEDENNKLADTKVLEQDSLEAYKSEITNKLQALIEKSESKKSNEPTFFKFISESNKTEFNNLNEEDQNKVIDAVEGRGYLTEGQILGLWKNSLIGNVITESTPNVIAMMPVEYHETWGKLSEGKKAQIMAQSKMVKLETAYQVANFWQTRDLRETAPVMEKLHMLSESKEVKSTIGYDTSDIAAQIANKFKK